MSDPQPSWCLRVYRTHICCFDGVRNRWELHAPLKGATLGNAEEDVDDTLKWIKRNKKKEKELAKKRQLELENRDKELR
jgi:U4/U6.U5 tri-snRNP-associated protein 1